ncbi:hypothetical protein Golob_001138 [Gossypium lobatum]|uniref:F-box domain-containing protein n=1 Tax=Gossypium lobatum TaxID=34289 RepID=A0A7J8NAK6_9ROSI|nr:hypothetical protein [Gossypium lobatum]
MAAYQRKRRFANQTRRDKDLDRLSGLPDKVLLQIISLLPLKEIVRTSILAIRWKDLFSLVSDISIDDNNVIRKSLGNGYMNIVERFLFSRKRDVGIDKFRLKCGKIVDPFRINGWIQYALGYHVKELDLTIGIKGFNELNFGVFTCKTLVILRLSMDKGSILSVPTYFRLPNLKVLHLGLMKCSDDGSVDRLFSGCISLEELHLRNCEVSNMNKLRVCNATLKKLFLSGFMGTDHEIEIITPNLVHFSYYYTGTKGFSLINLNSLSEARIYIGPYLFSTIDFSPTATTLMNGISQARSLYLTLYSSKPILLTPGLVPQFPNLTYLNLEMGGCLPEWKILLANSPCLDTLVLDFEFSGSGLESHYNGRDETEKVPGCLMYKVKTIKLLSFQGKPFESLVVEYLLKNAKVLERFTVRLSGKKRLRTKISKEVRALPRVSKKCQVTII